MQNIIGCSFGNDCRPNVWASVCDQVSAKLFICPTIIAEDCS